MNQIVEWNHPIVEWNHRVLFCSTGRCIVSFTPVRCQLFAGAVSAFRRRVVTNASSIIEHDARQLSQGQRCMTDDVQHTAYRTHSNPTINVRQSKQFGAPGCWHTYIHPSCVSCPERTCVSCFGTGGAHSRENIYDRLFVKYHTKPYRTSAEGCMRYYIFYMGSRKR